MAKMNTLGTAAGALVIIGGLNWGLVGLAKLNVVETLFGAGSMLTSAVYIIVGLSAIYRAYEMYAMQ